MLWITIDKSSTTTITKQVYNQLKDKILKNELKSGNRLPSTRRFAHDLSISRNIVIEVYEQLIAEGYLIPRAGSGTYIAEGLYLKKYAEYKETNHGERKIHNYDNAKDDIIDFSIGVPDLKNFPKEKWGKYLKNACNHEDTFFLNYNEVNGINELRITLSQFLLKTKGIRCNPEEIFILSGAMHGFSIISNVLFSSYSEVIIEDPSFIEIQNIFVSSGFKISPIPVDEVGIQTNLLPKSNPSGIISVTPSHHFPLGCVLPIKRRIQLIEYAQKNKTYIIENDYDSDFRFTGIPISSLQMLYPERVIHVGTFSEMLYPSVRLGYMVVPGKLIEPCMSFIKVNKYLTSSTVQLALSNFINDGELEKHILRMKKKYKKKRDFISHCLRNFFKAITISGDAAGLFIVVEFQNITLSEEIRFKIKQSKVKIDYVEDHATVKGKHNNKIILGYGNLELHEIKLGINRLRQAILC